VAEPVEAVLAIDTMVVPAIVEALAGRKDAMVVPAIGPAVAAAEALAGRKVDNCPYFQFPILI
jgi:hypothetical protein